MRILMINSNINNVCSDRANAIILQLTRPVTKAILYLITNTKTNPRNPLVHLLLTLAISIWKALIAVNDSSELLASRVLLNSTNSSRGADVVPPHHVCPSALIRENTFETIQGMHFHSFSYRNRGSSSNASNN